MILQKKHIFTVIILTLFLMGGVLSAAPIDGEQTTKKESYNSLEEAYEKLSPANMDEFLNTPYVVEENRVIKTHILDVTMLSDSTEFQAGEYFIRSSLIGAVKKNSEPAEKGFVDWLLGKEGIKRELRWVDVLPNVEITQTLYEQRLKEDIILRTKGAPTGFAFQIEFGAYALGTNTSTQNVVLKQEGDRIVMYGHENKEVIIIPAPFATDAAGEKYIYKYVLDGNTLRLLPVDDLKSAEYPLVIDPSYEIGDAISDEPFESNVRVLARGRTGTLYTILRTGVTSLYLVYSTNEGRTWEAELVPFDEHWYYPTVAVDSQENVYIQAYRTDLPSYDYLMTRYYSDGTWRKDRVTGDYAAKVPTPIAVDQYDNVHRAALWPSVGRTAIHHKYWNGDAWSAEKVVSNTTASYVHDDLTIGIDYSNNIHCVYPVKSPNFPGVFNLNYSTLSSGAGEWTGDTPLTADNRDHIHPCLSIDTLDRIHVVYEDHVDAGAGITNISYIEYNGSEWVNSTFLDLDTTALLSWPTIQTPKTNIVYVLWADPDPVPTKIYYNYRVAGTWSGPDVLVSNPTLNSTLPNAIMAVWPLTCNETRMNIPATGMSFVYMSNATKMYYFADDFLSWTPRTSWYLDVNAQDLVTGDLLLNFEASIEPGNFTDTTSTGTVTFPCMATGAYDLTVTSPGYYVGEKTMWLDSDKTSTVYLTPISGSGIQYPPHDVEYTVISIFGERYPDVYVNVTYSDNEEIKILNGTTDSKGSVTFEMERTIKYMLEFEKASESIDVTWYNYPKDDHYIILVSADATPYSPPDNWYDCINFTVNWTEFNSTHAYINFYYNDTCLGTHSVTFYINDTDENETEAWNFTHTGDCNESSNVTLVDHTGGASFFVGFIVDGHDTFGDIIIRHVIKFAYFLDVGLPLSACRMLSIAILFFMACFFGATSANAGAVIINIPAWTFYFWGWLLIVNDATTILVLGITTTISVIAYMTYRSRRVLND